jgi:hypothetical protein
MWGHRYLRHKERLNADDVDLILIRGVDATLNQTKLVA